MPKIVKWAVADLKPSPDNPRTVRDEGFRALKDSIQKFGLEDGATCAYEPAVVNVHPDGHGEIIGGQRRWEATAEIGVEHIWCNEASLSQEDMVELRARLNVPAGNWDWELLAESGLSGEQLLDWGFDDLEWPQIPPAGALPLEMPTSEEGGGSGEEEEAGGDAAPLELPVSTTRQLQLFYEEEEFLELIEILKALRASTYENQNPSQIILAVLRGLADEAD